MRLFCKGISSSLFFELDVKIFIGLSILLLLLPLEENCSETTLDSFLSDDFFSCPILSLPTLLFIENIDLLVLSFSLLFPSELKMLEDLILLISEDLLSLINKLPLFCSSILFSCLNIKLLSLFFLFLLFWHFQIMNFSWYFLIRKIQCL